MFKNARLRLLMRVVGFERFSTAADEEPSSPWIIPSRHSAEDLAEYQQLINKVEFDPPTFTDGELAEQQVRRKTAPRKKAVYDDDDDDLNDLIDDDGDALFPKNLPNKRLVGPDHDRPPKKRRVRRRKDRSGPGSESNELLSDDDDTDDRLAEKARKRRKRDLEKQRKIKSALYVDSEDDKSDAERDAEFFALEEAIRQRVKKALQYAPTDASELLLQQTEANSTAVEATLKRLMAGSDVEESDDDAESGTSSPRDSRKKEVASRKRKASGNDSAEEEDEETSPPPAKKAATMITQPKKKKSKLGFLVDSSDEEDQEDQDMDDAESAEATDDDDDDEEMETNDTPLSSNPKNAAVDPDEDEDRRSPLREKQLNVTTLAQDDDDDALPAAAVVAKRRPRVRAGFLEDSDDE